MPRGKPQPFDPAHLVSALLAWYPSHARDLPWRRSADPYAIWISEIMLQQTQVATVIPYWKRWLDKFPDVESVARSSEDRVLKLWEGLGYYSRARNIHRAARFIMKQHQGRFPRDLNGLLALPGVGRYTAGAIASIAFNQPEPILDGNVIRVLTRLRALPGDPKGRRLNARLWNLATDLVTTAARSDQSPRVRGPSLGPCSALNQSLMELGATVCTPRAPACPDCPLAAECRARQLDRPRDFPQTGRRPASILRRCVVVVLERDRRILVRQRPNDGVNAGLWEFPQLELTVSPGNARPAAARWLALPAASLTLMNRVKHSITRHRLHLEVFHSRVRRRPEILGTAVRWVTSKELEGLVMTGAHRRIARQLPIAGAIRTANLPR